MISVESLSVSLCLSVVVVDDENFDNLEIHPFL